MSRRFFVRRFFAGELAAGEERSMIVERVRLFVFGEEFMLCWAWFVVFERGSVKVLIDMFVLVRGVLC